MNCCCNALTGKAIFSVGSTLVDRNITDLVEAAGGDINAELRFSMKWESWSDLDLHLSTPEGEIFYEEKNLATGILDVDMNIVNRVDYSDSKKFSNPAVEHIAFPNFSNIPDGTYLLGYKQFGVYDGRESRADVPIIVVTRSYKEANPAGLNFGSLVITFTDRVNGNKGEKFNVAKFSKQGESFTLIGLAEGAVAVNTQYSKITVPDDPPRISKMW